MTFPFLLPRPIVLGLALGLVTAAAGAQQPPPPERGDRLVRVEMVGTNQVRMRDDRTGAILMDARNVRLHDRVGVHETVLPTIKVNPQPTGFDVVYEFHNDQATTRPLGFLRVGVITLGESITFRDFHHTQHEVQTNATTHKAFARNYPEALYSPVAVLSNQNYTVGVSLQYPIMEYKHDVLVNLRSLDGAAAEGEGGRGWTVDFMLTGGALFVPAYMSPGESRTYVVSVRVTERHDEWVRTLVPYRNYFRALYGGVQYERDPSPIMGLSVSRPENTTSSNPDGWATESRRPDVHGWGPWVRYLTKDQRAWRNIMIWGPSGMYRQNSANNYPSNFTSHWLDHPKLTTALDPDIGLPSIGANGQTLGLWWGRSTQVADRWDDPELEPFDPHNSQHVATFLREYELAALAGAKVIGLDCFVHRHIPVWEQVAWLQRLNQTAPGVRFCIEPSAPDVMHRLAATWVDGWTRNTNPSTPEDLYNVKHPMYLADFLLPGHETWVGLRPSDWEVHFGQEATPERIVEDMERHAAWGFRILVFAQNVAPTAKSFAAESWRFTVPPDLQIDDRRPSAAAAIAATPSAGSGSGNTGKGGSNAGAQNPARPKGDRPVIKVTPAATQPKPSTR